MREFDTGATRDSEEGKLDYEGALSPLVLRRYAEYMHSHRTQANGESRTSDNWQKGIPLTAYMKSMWRHFMDLWVSHRNNHKSAVIQDSLCAVIFNASGYLHELLKDQSWPAATKESIGAHVDDVNESLAAVIAKSAEKSGVPVTAPRDPDSDPHTPAPYDPDAFR